MRRLFPCLALWTLALAAGPAGADDWPQWRGPRHDNVWHENGIVRKLPAKLTVLWRTPLNGGYSGPAVADGKVYVLDRKLDAGQKDPPSPFTPSNSKGVERIVCLDARTGKELWAYSYPTTYRIQYPSGPRTTPVIAGGKVYTLGAMGDLHCLDTSGKKLWHHNFMVDYKAPVPTWGFSAHPLLDGKQLICLVGGKGSAVVSFDKDTGKELWQSGTVGDVGYAPASIVEAGGRRQLIVFDTEAVRGLDPANGKEFWSEPIRAAFAMSIAPPQKMGNHLFVTSFRSASMMLELDAARPKAKVAWKGGTNNSVYPCFATPHLEDGHIYGVDAQGEYRCVEAKTGKRLWTSMAPIGGTKAVWGNVFQVKNGDRFFLTNEHGELMIAKLSPKGYEEISRAKVLDPTTPAGPGRKVVWVHPAFANRCMYWRNDREIVCVSLAE